MDFADGDGWVSDESEFYGSSYCHLVIAMVMIT